MGRIFNTVSGHGKSVSYKIEPTYEARTSFILENVRDINKVFAGLYTADVVIEQKVLTEGVNPEILVENVFSTAWKKLKELWVKIKNKVVSWFKAILDYLRTLFTSGKKFVAKYGSEVKKRVSAMGSKVNDFEFNGYNPKKNDFEKGEDMISNSVHELMEGFKDLDKLKNIDLNDKDSKEYTDLENSIEEAYDNIDIESYREDIREYMLGEKETFKYNEGFTVDEMIDMVKGYDRAVRDMDKAQKKSTDAINAVIKEFDKFEKDNKPLSELIRKFSKFFNKLISLVTAIVSECKTCVDILLKQFIRQIKKLYLYKPKTESVTVDDSDLDVTDEPVADVIASTVVGDIDATTGEISGDNDDEAEHTVETAPDGDVTEDDNLLESCMNLF